MEIMEFFVLTGNRCRRWTGNRKFIWSGLTYIATKQGCQEDIGDHARQIKNVHETPI